MLAEFMGMEWLTWWQVILLPAALAVPVFGGGAMLWVGGRYLAKAPKATYWRSVGTSLLAALGSGVAYLLSFLCIVPASGLVGMVIGAVVALFVTWWIIEAMFDTTFGKAILAWLATLPAAFLTVAIFAAMLVPTLQGASALSNQSVCMSNLHSIGAAMRLYRVANDNRMPPDFQAVIADGQPWKSFICPDANPANRPAGQKWDYFYLPPKDDDPNRIIVCDFRPNHGGGRRHMLFNGIFTGRMTQEQFQALLARPENADFAAALRKAEGP